MSTPSTPSPAAHHFARLCQRSGRGNEGHPVRFRAMPSPPHRHHIASEQQPQGIASTFCHPARLVLFLVLPLLQVIRARHSKRARRREGRERTSAKDAAAIFASSSPLLLLRLMSSPSTSSPAAHHFARFCQRSWRGTGCHIVRFWAMQSPPHRHHLATYRPASSDHRAAPRRSAILPASSPSSSYLSGGDCRATSQPGRAIPSSSPRRTSPPCRGASAYMRTPPKVGEGVVSTYQGGEGRPCDSKFREILRGCIALNINYLFSPLGYAVQASTSGK